MVPEKNPTVAKGNNFLPRLFPAVFGGLLGLALLKFGYPVILDWKVQSPTSLADWISDPWPVQWVYWLLGGIVLLGLPLLARTRLPRVRWFSLLPLAWLAWQFIAAAKTIDPSLTRATLPHLAACVVCFYLGLFVVAPHCRSKLLWVGISVGLCLTLIKGMNQHNFEYRRDYKAMLEGDNAGWKETSTEVIQRSKKEGLLVETADGLKTNPNILDKLRRGRISGTLMYPNALAGAILLLFPPVLSLVVGSTKALRTPVRIISIGLIAYLGLGCLYWTGSKGGWLIALGMCCVYAFLHLPGSKRKKLTIVAIAGMIGLAAFVTRFSEYLFVKKAPSVGARSDYWRAAVRNTKDNPVLGSGPGTFFRAYSRLKSPQAEMTRLTHNDYLEQASDSGVPGFLLYGIFVCASLFRLARRLMPDSSLFPTFLGLLGWFSQGLIEFSLYIPGLAWLVFSLLGLLLGLLENTSTNSGPVARIPSLNEDFIP